MRRAVKWALSLALLAGVALWLGPQRMVDDLRRLSVEGTLLACAACLAHFLVIAWRWRMLLDLPQASVAWVVKVYLYGNFLNAFTPANLGNDVYRFAAFRPVAGGFHIFGCLVEERLLGLFFYFAGFVLFLGLALAGSAAIPPLFSQASLVCAAASTAMLLIPKANALIRRVLQQKLSPDLSRLLAEARFGHTLALAPRLAGYAVLSLGALALWTSTAYVVSRDLGCPLSWPLVGGVAILVELARFIPLTVQGVGVRESAFAFLYGLCGQPAETGFTVGLLTYLILNVVFLLNGLVSLLIPAGPPSKLEQPERRT